MGARDHKMPGESGKWSPKKKMQGAHSKLIYSLSPENMFLSLNPFLSDWILLREGWTPLVLSPSGLGRSLTCTLRAECLQFCPQMVLIFIITKHQSLRCEGFGPSWLECLLVFKFHGNCSCLCQQVWAALCHLLFLPRMLSRENRSLWLRTQRNVGSC